MLALGNAQIGRVGERVPRPAGRAHRYGLGRYRIRYPQVALRIETQPAHLAIVAAPITTIEAQRAVVGCVGSIYIVDIIAF